MTTNVGFATLSVIPSLRGFQGHLERGTNPALTAAGTRGGARFGDAAGRSAGQRFGRIFTATARAALIGGAGAAALAIKVGSDSVGLASDLAESQNKVDVVFKNSAKSVRRFGRESAKAIGLSEQKALEAAGTYGNLFVNLGVGEKQSAKMSKRMVRLASDLASFNNIAPEEAIERLRSGLLGEQEAVERLGVSLTEAGLKQRAFDMGLTDTTTGVLPAAVRTQAAYAEIMAQTGLAQGDFARTSDNLANKQRILSARWDDARASLGTALLPVMEDAVGFIIDKGIPAFEDFSDWFVNKGIPAFKKIADEHGPQVVEVFKSIKDFAKDAGPFVGDIVDHFNDMPDWVKKVLIGGAAGGLAAKKLGLGGVLSSGAKAATGGLLSKGGTPANPLYVFTVNGGGGIDLKKAGVAGFLASAGKFLAIAGGISAGITLPVVKQQEKAGTTRGFVSNDFLFGDDEAEAAERRLKRQEEFVDRLGMHWLGTKNKANDYFLLVRRNQRSELFVSVLGWDVANTDARRYLETLLQIRQAHMDTRLDRAGGTPNARPGSGIVPRGGITIGHQTVIAHDYKDFVQQSQRRTIAAASDGRPQR